MLWRNVDCMEGSFSGSEARLQEYLFLMWSVLPFMVTKRSRSNFLSHTSLTRVMNQLQHWTVLMSSVMFLSGPRVDESVLYDLTENAVQRLCLLNGCVSLLQSSILASCYMTNCKRVLLIYTQFNGWCMS